VAHTSPTIAQDRLDRRRQVHADDSMIGFTFATLACLATTIALVLWV